MKKRIYKFSIYLLPFRTILVFCTGFFLALAIIFKIDANYTEDLFQQLGEHILQEAKLHNENVEQTVKRAMNVTYKLQLENKKQLFAYSPQSFKGKYMRSSDLDLLDVSGACGSASLVLVRTYMAMGFPTRIGQMYANGQFGGHMLVEVWSDGRWMVMDPLFNQFFTRPDGSLASFEEVQNNFSYYSKQLHPGYPKEYQYQDVRYTNWDNIPVVSPFLKKGLDLIYGEKKADQLCIRKYLIKFYLLWHYVFLTGFGVCSFLLLVQGRVNRKKTNH